MLGGGVLAAPKEVPGHAAGGLNGGGLLSPVAGRTRPAARVLLMARLEAHRGRRGVVGRLRGLPPETSPASGAGADAAGGGAGTRRPEDHALGPRGPRQDAELLLGLLVHHEVVAVGDVVGVHLLTAPLHLLRPHQLAHLLEEEEDQKEKEDEHQKQDQEQ